MANPFPGMDLYLEDTAWSVVHANLTEEIARQLVPKLRPKYLVLTEQRFVITPADEPDRVQERRWPDVGVVPSGDLGTNGGIATLTPPIMRTAIVPDEIPVKTVEIWDAEHRRLVTAIEVLSPTNKRGEGRIEYAAKRQNILRSDTHLIEIDLLRAGTRFPVTEPLPPAAYFVFISRAEQRPRVDLWPIAFDAPLPPVPVPLLPGDADVSLDLQAAFTSVHDFYRYDRLVGYTGPPLGPLTAEQAAWVEERLQRSGRRGD